MEQTVDALAGQPLIIGAGLAGLLTALYLAPEPVIVRLPPITTGKVVLKPSK